jgi:hypothetical protein
MLRFVLISLLLAPVALTGCFSTQDTANPHLVNEDVPTSLRRAQALEEQALDKVSAGNRRRNTGKRRALFNHAISLLREARLCYEEELLRDGGKATPERHRNIEAEIKRISDHIALLHKDRPAE